MNILWIWVRNSVNYFLSILVDTLPRWVLSWTKLTHFCLCCVSGRFQKRDPWHQKSLLSWWECLSSWLRKGKCSPCSSLPLYLCFWMDKWLWCLPLIPRLLLAEKMGHLCRDDSVEGLRFYPNLFMTQS